MNDPDQLEGTRAQEFRVAGLNGGWHLWATFQAWRNIVSAAAKVNDMKLLDISSGNSTGLQFSEMRFTEPLKVQCPSNLWENSLKVGGFSVRPSPGEV